MNAIRRTTLVLLATMFACATDRELAKIGAGSLAIDELNRYFAVNFVVDESENVVDDVVKSRLLDALINERLLLEEASRRGLEISEKEIEAALAADAVSDVTPADGGSAPDRTLVGRRLLVEKLYREVLDQADPVSPVDVEAYTQSYRERLTRTLDRIRVRVISFESSADAERVYSAIWNGELTFTEALGREGAGPVHAAPISLSRHRAAPPLRDVLFGLGTGGVSRPLEIHGRFHLFEVVESAVDRTGDESIAQLALRELNTLRRERERRELLKTIRTRIPVELYEDRLPFRYVRDR